MNIRDEDRLERPDPDRFIDSSVPGSQEWWYFDAISDDGRDALAVVFYAALPFDPAYGVRALRHLDDPARHPAPDPLDHCAIGFSLYRDGKPVVYALNAHRRPDFSHRADPFRVTIAGNALDRIDGRYQLHVETPAVDRRHRIAAELSFEPASETLPLEFDLGHPGSPHLWMLAAPDCRVEATIRIDGKKPLELRFRGRGYHDHNAGAEEISRAIRRWAWGRFHVGDATHVYYRAEPHHGPPTGLWITCRGGRPERVRGDVRFLGDEAPFSENGRGGNVFGVRHGRSLRVEAESGTLVDRRTDCVDDGPFYRRWVARFEVEEGGSEAGLGLSEWLETKNLNRPLFNWMIPFRLRRPGDSRAASPPNVADSGEG